MSKFFIDIFETERLKAIKFYMQNLYILGIDFDYINLRKTNEQYKNIQTKSLAGQEFKTQSKKISGGGYFINSDTYYIPNLQNKIKKETAKVRATYQEQDLFDLRLDKNIIAEYEIKIEREVFRKCLNLLNIEFQAIILFHIYKYKEFKELEKYRYRIEKLNKVKLHRKRIKAYKEFIRIIIEYQNIK